MGNHPRSLRYRPIQSDISRLKFNKTTTTYKFDKGNQTICLRIRERVVRTGVVERTRTTTRSVNSPSRKKVKVRQSPLLPSHYPTMPLSYPIPTPTNPLPNMHSKSGHPTNLFLRQNTPKSSKCLVTVA